ncbi:ankyrin repeat domain-containing protein [Hydrogenophaga sp.]|uniref:ankyrin repeat domain-containing protein n=1 Tax=Hydrogenophaga sp. TaxID=1904254 RepID=UPI0026178428|nr:ankyrin repeat domain-containing protein [Hydrogenophaga sp.]MDM7949389.1 ankyrin repeat domain-containing protein [Hydrogenophaga sp.]
MQRRHLIASAALLASAPQSWAATPWQTALVRAKAMRDVAVRSGDQAYGAVVVDAQGRLVAEAPSRVIALQDPDAHAERQALLAAQRLLRRDDLGGLVLVGSSRACEACERAAARAGVALLVSPNGETEPALIEAAARDDVPTLTRLLDDGARIDTRDLRGRTPLLVAVQRGHDAAAQLLIRRGADINAQDDISDSPFLLAGARGRTAMLADMLGPPSGSPTRPDYQRLNRYGGTALIPACHYGHVETVRLLLKASRIDIDQVNHLGWTALLEAVILGDGGAAHTEIVRLLLAHGANPQKADAQGVSPLTHAQQRGQTEVATLLAEVTRQRSRPAS